MSSELTSWSNESSEYVEEVQGAEHPSAMDTTSSQRLKRKEARSHHTKARVDLITNQLGIPRRCLIENTHPNNHIDYAHCLNRSQNNDTLTRLEFHWKMNKGELNLDSRFNILFLSPKFHRCFDHDGFILLPERRFLEGYLRKAREDFPTIDDDKYEIYNYKLVALEAMDHVPLLREKKSETTPTTTIQPDSNDHNDNPGTDAVLSSGNHSSGKYMDNFTLFQYPYKDLPLLQTHVYPHYVIVKAGEKLLSITNLKPIQNQFFSVLTSVEYPRLSTLKWVVSSLLDQLTFWAASLLEDDPVQLRAFIQDQATKLVEHHSNLTEAQFSKLLRGQSAIFYDEPVYRIYDLNMQLKQLRERLKVLECNYPENSDDLALLVAVYLQWSVHPPPNHSFLHEKPPKSTRDDSSCVTGPRSQLHRQAKNNRSRENGGPNKRRRTGNNAGGTAPQEGMSLWLDDVTLKKFEKGMEKVTWGKKMSSVDWVKEVPKDISFDETSKVQSLDVC